MDEHSWATQAGRHESPASCRTVLAEDRGWTALVMAARFRNAPFQYCLEDDCGVRDHLRARRRACRHTYATPSRAHEQQRAIWTRVVCASERCSRSLALLRLPQTRHHFTTVLAVRPAAGRKARLSVRRNKRQTQRQKQKRYHRTGRRAQHGDLFAQRAPQFYPTGFSRSSHSAHP